MGACMSSSNPGIEVSDEDKRRHREAEKALKEVCCPLIVCHSMTNFAVSVRQAKSKMASQVKVGNSCLNETPPLLMSLNQVLLLGSGDSGKSTVLKVPAPRSVNATTPQLN